MCWSNNLKPSEKQKLNQVAVLTVLVDLVTSLFTTLKKKVFNAHVIGRYQQMTNFLFLQKKQGADIVINGLEVEDVQLTH